MIVDEKKVFISQRAVPKMALIKTKIVDENLILSAPDANDIIVPIKPPKNKCECKLVLL